MHTPSQYSKAERHVQDTIAGPSDMALAGLSCSWHSRPRPCRAQRDESTGEGLVACLYTCMSVGVYLETGMGIHKVMCLCVFVCLRLCLTFVVDLSSLS